MARASRQGDSSTGHGGYASVRSTGGSPNVFINGLPALRQGDGWSQHCILLPKEDPNDPNEEDKWACHTGVSSGGSPTVFVNGKPKMRVGDSISCGDRVSTGSSNVYTN